MEIPARCDGTVWQHHRIVDRRPQLIFGNLGNVGPCIAGRTVHLRGAAQRVRVLDPNVSTPVRADDQLRVRIEIKNKKASSKAGRGYVTAFQQIFNQDDIVVFSCEVTWMLAARP